MITLITTFYNDPSPERQEEINFALQNNLNNQYLDSIVLFVDRLFSTGSIVHPKIRFVIIDTRIPTYGDFLGYAATLPDGSIVVMANSDICFDHEIDRIRKWNLENCLAVLSRKEGRPGKIALLTEHYYSSDTWIIKTPVLQSSCDISLGILHCETAFICHMQQAGYTISNASLSVNSFHIHESATRRYSQVGSPYENKFAQAYPLLSGAFTSSLVSQRYKEAPLLLSLAALSRAKIVPFRIWKELLLLLTKYLPSETVLLSHINADLTSTGFPVIEGPAINSVMSLQETNLLDNICMEFGTRCYIGSFGSIPSTIESIAPVYDLQYELLHAESMHFYPEMFSHRFARNNFFFEETIMNQSRSLYYSLNPKKYCLLPRGKLEFFSQPDDDPTPLSSLGITRRFILLVGMRTGFASRGNAECLFKALSYNELYSKFQIVCVGGELALENKLASYPSARDTVILHPSDSILRKLYHHAFAHISTARIKGLELSNIEAMQCGCPVVIVQYDNPYRDYWGNCISTPTLEGEALQEIVTLLENRNIRELIGEAGLAYTRTLSYENTARVLGEFITDIYRKNLSST